ncbi:hypothetical protein DMN91_007739 [Ooceraea biroi]|uniref:DnaJ-like protein subfamily C member n=1 Tax=Ooceraea biroi TaxID=2015173 RepID=A0A026WT49_OOCBI|nr:dnaJ homolog subfamily C member 24 [Ooceraea biroi]EZA59240.1 DnaJ-like protein subfamily C member [Ooceraea biroi]RLU19182.1 hypothetical protein DMN91_007739 [Ooceraea biroi]
MQMNYYEVLGCNRDSSYKEIKHAYHQRLLQFHPDKNDATDNREFHDVREAWRVLGHPHSRKEYDAACKQEELEEEDHPVYERLSPGELEESDDTFFYRCRCGGCYFVEKDDLREKDTALRVMCDGCTLIIVIQT